MAFLLGNESCIEGLRSDLSDLQETIDEILVRNGPVKCYSWKSPDKLVSDIKVKELMERFKYGTDEVDNQVAHYSLLELIVDRLLLLIHLSSSYAETSLTSDSGNNYSTAISNSNNNKIARLTAGLSIKKYWNKFTQLCSTIRQLNCQNKAIMAKQKPSAEELRSSQNMDSNQSAKNSSSGKQSISTKPNNSNKAKVISEEVSSKSVQTHETAFVPCESCAKVQTNLKQNADEIINMCHYQDITSQVGKYRASLMANQLVGGWLNGTDLEKWLLEQNKDLSRISKQLEFLSKNNELLKNKMSENDTKMNKMQSDEKELKKTLKDEQELRSITMKQYEKKMSDQKIDFENKINRLENELNSLNNLKISIEEKYESLKNLNDNNEKIIIELNETNRVLSEEFQEKKDQTKLLQKMEEEKLVLQTEFDCLKRELNEKSNELNNERGKLENSIRIEQSLKLKNETLLDNIDKLTVECENLSKRVDDSKLKSEHKQLIEAYKSKEIENEKFKYDIEILQNSVSSLHKELKKSKENEILMMRYPDLYGPIDQLNDNEMNVCDDMINQINANKYRINLLENLNKKLNNSIKKLNETQVNNEKFNDTVMTTNNDNHETSLNYFMKPPQSTSRTTPANSNLVTPRNNSASNGRNVISRPVPLFKLENEIDEIELLNEKISPNTISNGVNKPNEQQKYWSQNDSVTKNNTLIEPSTKLFNDESEHDEDEEEELNFLKDKRESDKNYLEKLNQISQVSELKIENTDFSLLKNRRNVSSRGSPFLYTPSTSQLSMNNDPRSTNQSRVSNYSANKYNTSRPNSRAPLPVPPAEKNMEVIVGKGRSSSRPNSALNKASGGNGSNSNIAATNGRTNNQKSTNIRDKDPSTEFKCENCDKNYTNIKDFDIHKLYCSKK